MNGHADGVNNQCNTDPNEQLIKEALIAECRDTGERIVELLTSLERILATGAAVLAIIGSVVVASDRAYFLMLLPAALSVVLVYAEFVNNDIKTMGAYKAALEEEIESRLGFPVISWESTVARLSQFNRLYQYALGTIFLLALGGSIWVALVQAFATGNPDHWGHKHSIWYILGTILSIGVGVAAVIAGYFKHEKNMRRTKDYVTNMFKAAKTAQLQTAQATQQASVPQPPPQSLTP
jgi:hypothetical protein